MEFSNIIDAYLSYQNIKPINKTEFERLINDIASFRKLKKYKKEITHYLLDNFYTLRHDIYLPKKLHVTNFEIAQAYARYGYFSHDSALQLHGLHSSSNKNIYISEGIKPTPPSGIKKLNQSNIDLAFQKSQRTTKKSKKFDETTIHFLQGQSLDLMNVVKDNIRVSDIEKTLIDITVRPSYSGGSKNVLQSFVKARSVMDPEKLIRYYKKLSFIYPYNQSLDFIWTIQDMIKHHFQIY